MYYVGVDLHKQSISLCVVELVDRKRKVIERRRFRCDQEEQIADYFASLGEYQLVVEATASYEWFVQLVEPTADRVVLAHPGHLRVIAQSKRKTDKLDAQTLAEFLALIRSPEAWRPTPRVRQHRALVRHRQYVVQRRTSVKNKIRRVLMPLQCRHRRTCSAKQDESTSPGFSFLRQIALRWTCSAKNSINTASDSSELSSNSGRSPNRHLLPNRKLARC